MLIAAPFATPNDVASRWRTLNQEETAKATVLLIDASSFIVDEYPSANTVADDDPDALASRTATLKRITCAMVKRAMMPGGTDGAPVMEVQQTAGPFGHREKLANPMGDLYLTKSERASLNRQVAFTVSMHPDGQES